MLLGVAAAVYAFERREIIRQTWGAYAETENVKVALIFSHIFAEMQAYCIF